MNVQMKKITLAFVSALSMGSAIYAGLSDENINKFRDLTALFDESESNDFLDAMDMEAYDLFPELQQLDQPFCYFKTTARDPYMIKYNSGSNQVEMLTCGTQLPKSSARHIGKPEELKNLVVLRSQLILSDANLQMDTKHEGFREQFFGRVAEALLQSVGLLSVKPYSGTFMVDEYLAGIPMKWVLKTDKELACLLEYLVPQLQRAVVSSTGKKPLLAVQLVKNGQQVSMVNKALLDTYFTVVDQSDAAIKPYYDEIRGFFEKSQRALNDALAKYSKDTPVVGLSFGEQMFAVIEKQSKDFKIKDVIAAAAGAWLATKVAGSATDLFNKQCASPTTDFLDKKQEEYKDYCGYAVKTVGGVAAFIVFYTALKIMIKDEYEKSLAGQQALLADNTPEVEAVEEAAV